MLITMVQTEIEAAIKEYIHNNFFNIAPDQEMDITLRATRGEEGYQATVDLRAKGSAIISSAAPVAEKAAETKPLGIETKVAEAKATPKPVTKAKADTTIAVTRSTPVAKPKAEVVEEPVAEETPTPVAEEADVVIPDEEVVPTGSTFDTEPAVEETPAAAVKSLFAGKTSKPAPADAALEASAEPAEKPQSIFGDMRKPVNA